MLNAVDITVSQRMMLRSAREQCVQVRLSGAHINARLAAFETRIDFRWNDVSPEGVAKEYEMSVGGEQDARQGFKRDRF